MEPQLFRAWTRFDDGCRLNIDGTAVEVESALRWYANYKGARLIKARIKRVGSDRRTTEPNAFVYEKANGIPMNMVAEYLNVGDA